MAKERDVRAAMIAAIGDGAVGREALITRIAADGSLGHASRVRSACERILAREPSFGEVGDQVCYIPALAEGTTWAVPVDAEEAAKGYLRLHPALSAIGWWLVSDGADLVDADGERLGTITTDDVFVDGVETDVVVGPQGWLDGVTGGWVAGSVRSGALRISPIPAPSAPSRRQIEAIREGFATTAVTHEVLLFDGEERSLRYADGDRPVQAALLADREAFTGDPVPHLPELYLAAGLEQRSATLAEAGFDWEALEEWRARNRMKLFYGLDDRGVDALVVVVGACGQYGDEAAGALGPSDEQREKGAVLLSALLEEDGVAEAFVAEAITRGIATHEIAAFADELASWMDPVVLGGLGWVRAACLREHGKPRAAAEMIDELVAGGSDHRCVLVEGAANASDRGDAVAALRLLQRAGVTDDDPEEEARTNDLRILREVVPYTRHRPRATTGRNEPCPCGSGRKYKSCHLGKERHDLADRSSWLYDKAVRYAHTSAPDLISDVAADIARDSYVLRRELTALPLVADLALHEHGLMSEFLEDRGWMLPDDEQLLAAQWTLVDRGVFEILGVRGDELRLRNVGTGDTITVVNTHHSPHTRSGMMLLGRPLPVGDVHRAFAGFVSIPPQQVNPFVDALATNDADGVMELLAARFAPPQIRNTSGEEMVMHTITWEIDDLDGVAESLTAAGMSVSGDDAWSLNEDTSGMRDAIIAMLRLERDESQLVGEVNSDQRATRVREVISAALPAARLLSDERRDFDEHLADVELDGNADDGDADVGAGGISMDDPQVRALVEEMMRQKELDWLDEEIPALGGRTPRDAVADPIGREEVRRLLASIPELPPDDVGFSAARLSALLGLDGDG